ncbi:hypothetical protein BLNAU_21826 [Blattamonas nauphoetae]|uniref:Uncharacterized protein n=1 Tax=Blattamonas nauphoetae TaxID=2049346 RepID=A0ABQ9WVV0_9EUKA|nr:hypothetical protein BLNAU_21826 [Blattamonas nauphoetae]
MSIPARVIQTRSEIHTSHAAAEILPVDPGCVSLWIEYSQQQGSSLDQKVKLYYSLVSLTKAHYPLDDTLQDKAVHFLTRNSSYWRKEDDEQKKLNALVPNEFGKCARLIDDFVKILSLPHTRIVEAALSFSTHIFNGLFSSQRLQILKDRYVLRILSAIDPQALPIASHFALHVRLIEHIKMCLSFAQFERHTWPSPPFRFMQENRHNLVFQLVVVPCTTYLNFLRQNRHALTGKLLTSFLKLLSTLLVIGLSHIPTLDFVLSHRLLMTIPSFVSTIEFVDKRYLYCPELDSLLSNMNMHGSRGGQSSKRLIEALLAEGLEDSFEQVMKYDINTQGDSSIVRFILAISGFVRSKMNAIER